MSGQDQASFDGLRVAAFESRRAAEMSRMIERAGGEPHVSPSMREVPIESNQHTSEFANKLLTGQIDAVIFLTGVGFRHLLSAVELQVDRQRFLDTLSDVTTIARGPKPVAAMKEVGLQPTWVVPEPNTWRELLTTIDQNVPIANQVVAIQEYGKTNASLVAGLEARGARPVSVPVYRWDMPEDDRPLRDNIQAIVAADRDVSMFTSAIQVNHLVKLASEMDVLEAFKRGVRKSVVCSIGPTTSEALVDEQLPVDFEPQRPKMGHLVREAAAVACQLKERKQRIQSAFAQPTSDVLDVNAPWYDSPFMKACRREPVDVTPVWLMRQAGRYLPEYRDIRSKVSFAELCRRPELCTEIMVSTVNRLGVDAAIIFSDLLPMLEPMGLELEYVAGDGPVIHNPIRTASDLDRISALEDTEALSFVTETVRMTRAELAADIPVIGFAGSPFTLASYAIEGGSSRNYLHTKNLMRRDPGAWHELMTRFAQSVTVYLNAQIVAGAQCVQIFDSWAGCLSVADYRKFVLPYIRDILVGLPYGVPVISFATGNPMLLPCLAEASPHVVGVDWRIPLLDAWNLIGPKFAVQGNIDPTILFADIAEVRRATTEILQSVAGRPGHIFNLGHGVLPETPVDNVLALIDTVHNFKASV